MQPDDADPYEVLGLSRRADDVVVRAAWKALMRKYHPDTSTAPDAAERAAKINAAFKLLVTPEARKAYDRRSKPAPPPPRSNVSRPMASGRPNRTAPPSRRPWLGRTLMTTAFLLAACAALYASMNDMIPRPVQQFADRLVADPAVASMRESAHRLIGFSVVPAYAAPPEAAEPLAEPPPMNEAAIAARVEAFDRLIAQGGTSVAAEARNCIERAGGDADWAQLDDCAALYLAGQAKAEGLLGPSDPALGYFGEAALSLPERYAALSDDNKLIAARISRIREQVWNTLLRKNEARLRGALQSTMTSTGEGRGGSGIPDNVAVQPAQ